MDESGAARGKCSNGNRQSDLESGSPSNFYVHSPFLTLRTQLPMASEPLVVTWDEETVQVWLSSIGYSQYYEHIVGQYMRRWTLAHLNSQQTHRTEHGISGDVLIHLDFETLRDIGITSAGHRLDILKAIYRLKLENGIPIESDHYVPLCGSARPLFSI